MKKIELLAPAGNMDSLKAAVSAGCDAIYLGLTSFSARAFAGNFTHEEFKTAIAYCHIRDVKIYVTINTMLYETEIENAKKEVDFLYRNDCDGILIQDLGLFHYVRTCYPDMPVHCSTQMHIHNLNGVKMMQKEGAARAVLARETPIEIIEEACKTGMEIEVFVYGAICISYSGQCLFSSSSKNRSANRGVCAQCCRLKYYPEDHKHFQEGDYILSPKDLNVIDEVPDLIRAGVSSLKIEGRMKRPEYVYLAVKTFREAIDAYYEGRTYHTSPKRQKELYEMFNRGFSKGHLFHAHTEERMSQYRPNHQGVPVGKVLEADHSLIKVLLTDSLHQHDGLRILHEPNDIGLTAVKIEKNGKLVNSADTGNTVILTYHDDSFPKKGDILHKTSDSVLMEQIDHEIAEIRRSPIKISYIGHIDMPFEVMMEDNQGHQVHVSSEQAVQKAMKAPLSKERIEEALSKVGEDPYQVESIKGEAEGIFLPVSVLNETRRKAIEQLNQLRSIYYQRKGKKEYTFVLDEMKKPAETVLLISDHPLKTDDSKIAVYTEGKCEHCVYPVIQQDLSTDTVHQNCIISSVGDCMHIQENVIAGMTLNIANSYAAAYILSKGVNGIILSSEMNEDNIRSMMVAFKERYGFMPAFYQLVYGRRNLMYIKDSFLEPVPHAIKDLQGNVYPVIQKEGCTIIQESTPVHHENANCYGSVYILDSEDTNIQEILRQA